MIQINANNEERKIHNFWSNIHFHPTDAVEDNWGQAILNHVYEDKLAKFVRLYVMLEDIVSTDENGKLIYDYSDSDKRLDYMVSKGFHLLLCFAYTPVDIASDKLCVSEFLRYKGKRINTSPPCDFALWEEICYAFTKHLCDRYGSETIAQWYFHCWNEADLEFFWMTGCKDVKLRCDTYCKLYDSFEKGVRKASSMVKIGGPSLAFPTDFLQSFLRHIKATSAPEKQKLDFLSIHTYGSEPEDLAKSNILSPKNTLRIYQTYRRIADEEGFQNIEIINDEWEACSNGFSNAEDYACLLYRNTEKFSAQFISLIDCYLQNNVNLSKMMICLSGQHNLKKDFEGYRSFFTMSGFKKPIYNAYVLAGMLGETLLQCDYKDGIGVLPTKDDDGNIKIALYYTNEYLQKKLENKLIHLSVELPLGKLYTVTHYRVDQDNCNAYSAWCKCGKPINPNQEQRERIIEAGNLKPWYEDTEIYEDTYTTSIIMSQDSVSFLNFEVQN